MEKEQHSSMIMDFLKGNLSDAERSDFETLLTKDQSFKEQFLEMQALWEGLATMEVPEPSEAMDAQFFSMLHEHQEQHTPVTKTSGAKSFLDGLFYWILKPQFAYGLLFVTLLGGFIFSRGTQEVPKNVETVSSSETAQVREKLVLTLLEQNSANKRLEGVSEANKIGKVDEQVINALLRTLNKDPNVNVRLAAIESLTNYVDNPKVRQGLIQSIPNQESPIIQVTLANLMLALEERKSIAPFQQLLEKPELDTTVKKKIEKTIKSII